MGFYKLDLEHSLIIAKKKKHLAIFDLDSNLFTSRSLKVV